MQTVNEEIVRKNGFRSEEKRQNQQIQKKIKCVYSS